MGIQAPDRVGAACTIKQWPHLTFQKYWESTPCAAVLNIYTKFILLCGCGWNLSISLKKINRLDSFHRKVGNLLDLKDKTPQICTLPFGKHMISNILLNGQCSVMPCLWNTPAQTLKLCCRQSKNLLLTLRAAVDPIVFWLLVLQESVSNHMDFYFSMMSMMVVFGLLKEKFTWKL